jgi:hypothetical protein
MGSAKVDAIAYAWPDLAQAISNNCRAQSRAE